MGFDVTAWWARSGLTAVTQPPDGNSSSRSIDRELRNAVDDDHPHPINATHLKWREESNGQRGEEAQHLI